MRAIRTDDRPPWPYAGTSLSEPTERMTFAVLAGRIASFDRDALLDLGTRIMWFIWERDVTMDHGNMVTRFATPWLIALSCVYGGGADRRRPSEHEFRLLCWELHSCAEPSDRELPEARAARAAFRERYDQLPPSHTLRRIPVGALDYAWGFYVMGLVVQAQSRPFAYMPSDLVRPFLVYETMRAAVAGAHLDDLRALERAFFGVPWDHVLRAFVVALALVGRDACGPMPPGVFALAPDADLGASLGVTPADLRVLLARLGTPRSSFPARAAEVDALPEHAKKHSEIVRCLDARPVIVIDDDDRDGVFRCVLPSPWHARSAFAGFVLDEFVAFAAEHSTSRPLGADPWSLRGNAFHSVLGQAVRSGSGVLAVDDLYAGTQDPPQHPDFVWLGQRYGILVEAKVRLSPNADSWGRAPTSLFEGWRRGAEALDQCAAYLGRGMDGHAGDVRSRVWIAVIVTLQSTAAEATSFRSIVKQWDLLSGTGLSAFAIVSAAEFEHFVLDGNPDAYAEALHRLWDALVPDSLERASEGVRFAERRVSAPINDAWGRLLPGLNPVWDPSE